MKKFKLLALLVCVLAITSAFIGQKKSSSPSYYGWSFYPGTGPTCYNRLLDWGFQCDNVSYGQLCTIGGGAYSAYASEFGCEYKLETELLYRVNP